MEHQSNQDSSGHAPKKGNWVPLRFPVDKEFIKSFLMSTLIPDDDSLKGDQS